MLVSIILNLMGTSVVPPVVPPETQFASGGGGIDIQAQRMERLKIEDEEWILFLKCWAKLN